MSPHVARIVAASALVLAGSCGVVLALAAGTPGKHPAPRRAAARAVDARDLGHCRLRAVHPADNDIRLDVPAPKDARPVPLPPPVARAILDRATSVARSWFSEEEWRAARRRCGDIFAPILQIDGPDGLALYVAPRDFGFGGSVDHLLMFDPRSGAVTPSPPLIYTKWSMESGPSDPLIKAPVVRFQAGEGGRRPLIVVEERTHNGNVYDAAVDRYFEIGANMALTQVLAVEARAIILGDRDEYTERKATFLTPESVRIDVSSRSPRHLGARGSVTLERPGPGAPFHVARRMPADGRSGQGLITYCDTARSDDEFLKVGCDFYY